MQLHPNEPKISKNIDFSPKNSCTNMDFLPYLAHCALFDQLCILFIYFRVQKNDCLSNLVYIFFQKIGPIYQLKFYKSKYTQWKMCSTPNSLFAHSSRTNKDKEIKFQPSREEEMEVELAASQFHSFFLFLKPLCETSLLKKISHVGHKMTS